MSSDPKTTFVYRRFFCKTPTKLVDSSWRFCWPIYEVTSWRHGPSIDVEHTGTEYYTKADLTMLTLGNNTIAYEELNS